MKFLKSLIMYIVCIYPTLYYSNLFKHLPSMVLCLSPAGTKQIRFLTSDFLLLLGWNSSCVEFNFEFQNTLETHLREFTHCSCHFTPQNTYHALTFLLPMRFLIVDESSGLEFLIPSSFLNSKFCLCLSFSGYYFAS